MNIYKKIEVNGKPVFIVESHATALLPWATIRRNLNIPPNLITVDYHSDTNEAFHRYIYGKTEGDSDKAGEIRESLIAAIDISSDDSLQQAIAKLNNDEQIDCAIRSEIINLAVVIQYEDSTEIMEPNGTCFPENRIYTIPNICAVGCEKETHDGECEVRHADQAIESKHLNSIIDKAQQIHKCLSSDKLMQIPYILDIDLDYFRTRKSIAPGDASTFKELARNSIGITIAKETEFVKECRLKGENIDSDFLLKTLLDIIEAA